MKEPKRLKGMHTPSHARSKNQERELARRVSGRVTQGSGNGLEKGDVRLKGVCRIEAKTTMAKSFSVTREMVEKIEIAAISSGELPVLVVEFLGSDGKPQSSVALMPMWVLDIISQKTEP